MSDNKMLEKIMTIFTSEDQKELKSLFKTLIINQFKNDLASLDVYLFDCRDIEEMINEVYQEVLDEIKVELKNAMRDKMLKLLDDVDFKKLMN